MSDQQETPRYAVRKRPTPPETVDPVATTPSNATTFTSIQKEQTTPQPPNNPPPPPHQLTINGRTFLGPLPQAQAPNTTQNATIPPNNHPPYILFTCPNCPIHQLPNEPDLHALCLPTHPCIWPFPPKAREAHANRTHWLALAKPLEETRLPSGRLPQLLDGNGARVTRGLIQPGKGLDLNAAYDEVVRRRYRAVVKGEESWGFGGAAEGGVGVGD